MSKVQETITKSKEEMQKCIQVIENHRKSILSAKTNTLSDCKLC